MQRGMFRSTCSLAWFLICLGLAKAAKVCNIGYESVNGVNLARPGDPSALNVSGMLLDSATWKKEWANDGSLTQSSLNNGHWMSKTSVLGNADHWLRVDMGASYCIQSVWIWTRNDCCQKLQVDGAEVIIGDGPVFDDAANLVCATIDWATYGPELLVGNAAKLQCAQCISGRYVFVHRSSFQGISVREIEIYEEVCNPCQVGQYKATPGSQSCLPCDPGSFLNSTGGSACVACPANADSPAGSDAITDCVCNVGYEGSFFGCSARETCGCPGWQFPASAFIGVGATTVDINDCTECQSPEAVSVSGGSYLGLGALTYNTAEVTYAVWVYAATAIIGGSVFDFGNGGEVLAGSDNHHLQYVSGGVLAFYIWWNGALVASAVDNTALPLNTWKHVAVTISGGTLASLYVDGELRVSASGVFPQGSGTRSSCLIGDDNNGISPQFWDGKMADFSMYGRALSAVEVMEVKLGILGEESSRLSLFPCYPYTPSCPLASVCGCSGWEIPNTSLINGAEWASVPDCSGCMSENGVVFTGTDQYVDLGSLTYNDTAVTYMIWIYATSLPYWNRVIDFSTGPFNDGHRIQAHAETGRLMVQSHDSLASTSKEFYAPDVLALNTWVHVALTVDGSAGALWLGGVQVASGSMFTGAVTTRTLCYLGWDTLGGSPADGRATWRGRLSDFRMFSRAISAAEVWQAFKGTLAEVSSVLAPFGCAELRRAFARTGGVDSCLCKAGYAGPTTAPDNSTEPCSDIDECKLPAWKLVFRQTLPFFFTPQNAERYSPEDPSAPNYSVLDELESLRGADGKLHFKLYYPEVGAVCALCSLPPPHAVPRAAAVACRVWLLMRCVHVDACRGTGSSTSGNKPSTP